MTVTIGSGLKDIHGNPLIASTTIAVTTGDKIAVGRVQGRIYGDPPLNAMLVGAWQVADSFVIQPDSIVAPYLTQANETGDFTINFMPEGFYRILCWEDRNRDKLYQAGVDRLGIAPKDIYLIDDSLATVDLFAVKRDTTRLFPVYLTAQDNRHVQLRLSKKVSIEANDWLASLSIRDSLNIALLYSNYWIDSNDSARIIYLTEPQMEGMKYRAGFSGDTTVFDFKGSDLPDSSAPKIVASIPIENESVDFLVRGSIIFNDKILPDSLAKIITLTIGDSLNHSVSVSQDFPNILEWSVIDPLNAGARCLLSVDLSRVTDFAGNPAGDTTWTLFFKVIEPGLTGEISGQVETESNFPVFVAVKPITGSKKEWRTRLNEIDRSFKLSLLSPGDYRVWCWEDRDNNGEYSAGNLMEFSFSEHFTFATDTVTVRSRWETGGIMLKLQ